ncbi:MAG: DUF1415 domain-containing protein [Leucothrix sp.]
MNDLIITQTQKWIETVIVAHNFCPFAKREMIKRSIQFDVVKDNNIEPCLESVILACEELDKHPAIETTLLIFPNGFADFEQYLDLLDLSERLLEARRYDGIYQLASFHPEYCFDEAASDDPANYTNRSPYPMLHLLREATIEQALKNIDAPESIPLNNIEHARMIGLEALQKQLENCFERSAIE